MKERDRLHQRFLCTRDIIDWDNYKSYRNNVKRDLKKAKNEYNSNEVWQHKDNPRSLWKIVNRLIPSKRKERQIYKGDHKSLANYFNQFFSSVGENAARASTHLVDTNNINLRESIETVVILGRIPWPIFVQFCCPPSGTTFNSHKSIDFYMLSSNLLVVTRTNLQFSCISRSNIKKFHCFESQFPPFCFRVLHVVHV